MGNRSIGFHVFPITAIYEIFLCADQPSRYSYWCHWGQGPSYMLCIYSYIQYVSKQDKAVGAELGRVGHTLEIFRWPKRLIYYILCCLLSPFCDMNENDRHWLKADICGKVALLCCIVGHCQVQSLKICQMTYLPPMNRNPDQATTMPTDHARDQSKICHFNLWYFYTKTTTTFTDQPWTKSCLQSLTYGQF